MKLTYALTLRAAMHKLPPMSIVVDNEELVARRAASDANQLANRWHEALLAITGLGLVDVATRLDRAGCDASYETVRSTLESAKLELLKLRAEANAAGHSGNVAPIRSALDRLGALWAVAL